MVNGKSSYEYDHSLIPQALNLNVRVSITLPGA